MADLLLADAVDAAEPLFEAVRVPRQVVVDHQVGVLEVDAFAGGVGGDQHADSGSERNSAWMRRRSSRWVPPWMVTMASALPSTPAIFCVQVVQRVAVLGEDDDLALAAAGVAHVGVVLQDAWRVPPTCGPARRRRRPWPAVRVAGG